MAGVLLADELLECVGRLGRRGHVLPHDVGALVAVDAGGGGVDDAGDAVLAGGLQHVQGAVDVDVVGADGVLDGAGDAGPGGGVEDAAGALGDGGYEGGVGDGALDEGRGGVEVGALAGRVVVEDDYLMAELDEAVDEVGAYEAAAACDDVLHGLRAEPRSRAGSLRLLAIALLRVLVPML